MRVGLRSVPRLRRLDDDGGKREVLVAPVASPERPEYGHQLRLVPATIRNEENRRALRNATVETYLTRKRNDLTPSTLKFERVYSVILTKTYHNTALRWWRARGDILGPRHTRGREKGVDNSNHV